MARCWTALLAERATAAGWPSRSPGRRVQRADPAFQERDRGRGAPPDRRGEAAGTRSRRPPSGRWPTRSTSCGRQRDDLAELRRAVAPAGPAARRPARPPGGGSAARAGWTSAAPCAPRWHRRRAGGHPPPAAQAAQARAGRALRRQRLGRRRSPLHADADLGAAGAVHQGAGLRVRRHLRRGHPLLPAAAPTSSTRSRGWPRGRRRLVRRAQRLRAPRSRCSPTGGRDAVGPKTSLLVLGDARTNYRPPGLPVLRRPGAPVAAAHWLNPEPRRLLGHRRLRRRPRTARSSTWSSAATPRSWRSSSPRSERCRRPAASARRRGCLSTGRHVDPAAVAGLARQSEFRREAVTESVLAPLSARCRRDPRPGTVRPQRRGPDCDRLHGGAGRGGPAGTGLRAVPAVRQPGPVLWGRLRWARIGSFGGRRPSRDHGWHVRPHPPWPPRRRQRGRRPVRAGRGRVRADRPAVAEDRARGQPARGPLPDDGHRHRVQPAVHGQPGRHRPRRPDVHDRHPQRPAPASGPTPSCSSSPAPTRWPRSSAGATTSSCSTWRTSSA